MHAYDQYRRNIVACCQWLCEHGYFGSLLSAGGNVSVRIRDAKAMAITPSGREYMRLTPQEVCIVGMDRHPIDGDLEPSIETGMHAAIYRSRPDVGAVVHTHQPFASVFALIGKPIPALFDEVALAIGEQVALIPYAFSGTQALADLVARAVDNGCCCFIMQNHGALSLGANLEQAWKNSELLEKTAQVYYHALTTGLPVTTLPASTIERIRQSQR